MHNTEYLIIHHHLSFYVIVTKAQEKNRPLFNFYAPDDVLQLIDAAVEKDKSQADKVVLQSW